MKTFSIMFAVLLFISAASAQTDSKEDARLTSLIRQLADAQLAYDVPALDGILTSDYIEISPLGEFDPRDKVLSFYKEKPAISAKADLDIADVSIRTRGDVAIVIVKLTYFVAITRAPTGRSMRATFVCRKEKTGWKIASAQYTAIRPK